MKRDLDALTGCEHDLVVVGGGICGAAAAWDAAQRGLAVALLEADDFGSGTSWNSLKTIHGGLRHLQRADFVGLRESVRERRALLTIAPEIVRPLPFLVPTYGHGLKGREALAIGLRLGDLLNRDRNRGLPPEQRIPRGEVLSRRDVLERVPGIPEAGLNGGVVWTDAQVLSSERLVVGFVLAAAAAGAVVANHVEAVGVLRSGPRVVGVRARDTLTGLEREVRARMVLNAAGPGMDRFLALACIARPPIPLLRASNLVLSRPVVAGQAVGASAGGRFLFLVPWRDRAMVGTEYEPAELPPRAGAVAAFREDAARAYPWARIEPGDVSLVHRGLVPGCGGAAGLWTRSRLVDHQAEDGVPGMISVLAVKYTTARGLAEKAVDRVVRRLGRAAPASRTAVTPLPAARVLTGTVAERARHAVREEMALTLADAVLRRTDLGTAGPAADADVEAALGAMALELGWDAAQAASERRALARAYNVGE